MTGDLPTGWTWTTLEKIASWGSGGTPKRSEHRYYGGNIPWAVIGDLNDGMITECGESITQEGLDNSSCKLVEWGTVLVAMYGSIGKLGIAGMQMATNQAIAFANPHVDRNYLFYYLLSQRHALATAGKGATQRNISQTVLKPWPIPVAPSAEQKRIVAAIEEHFSRLAAAESALHLALQRVEAFRSSLLADAFHANARPPSDWKLTTIGDIATVELGRQRSPQHHAGSQMRPYLRAANVTWQGIATSDVKQMNFDDADFAKHKLETGDLLLNEASGSPSEVGKPAIWNGEIENCCFQNTLLRLRPHEIEVEYLYWYCYAAARSGRFGDAGRGVNIRHLGKQGLARFPVLIPPIEQRGQIVGRLEDEFHQTATLEQAARSALDRVAALRRSILAAAFSGQLVSQDPNDEPASVLLERIAAAPTPNGPEQEPAESGPVS